MGKVQLGDKVEVVVKGEVFRIEAIDTFRVAIEGGKQEIVPVQICHIRTKGPSGIMLTAVVLLADLEQEGGG